MPLISIRKSPIHGKGVFALQRIRPGKRIIEYKGEIIGARECNRRTQRTPTHTFMMELSPHWVIDGGSGGNSSRFINHSCDPNCEIEVKESQVFIHALKNIQPGTELTLDYRLSVDLPKRDWKKLHPCYCSSSACRGTQVDSSL